MEGAGEDNREGRHADRGYVPDQDNNPDRESFGNTGAMLAKFFEFEDRLETIMKLDDTILAIWLLNAIKYMHESLYTTHVAHSKPSFDDALLVTNSIRLQEDLEKRSGRLWVPRTVNSGRNQGASLAELLR